VWRDKASPSSPSDDIHMSNDCRPAQSRGSQSVLMSKARRIGHLVPGLPQFWNGYRAWRDWYNTWRNFKSDFERFAQECAKAGRRIPEWDERFPCLGDKTQYVSYEPHYVYHCAWACRVLRATRPSLHIDISSSIYFVSMASAFLDIKHFDYRPPKIRLSGLDIGQADLLHLPFLDNSISSISCLHVLEHIGLGRYGDKIDANGDSAAARELDRVLAKDGQLLVAVPVGRPRVNFNAHRVYAFQEVRDLFSDLELRECVLIPDQPEDGWIPEPVPSVAESQEWGCGCFAFVKA